MTNAYPTVNEQDPLSRPLAAVVRRPPVTCPPDTLLKTALGLMRSHGVGSLIVTDAGDQPVGIFTLHDLLNSAVADQFDLTQPIAAAMTARPFSLPGSALAEEAALAMAEHDFRHVLVTDQQRLVGVVSERDLFSLQRVGLKQISRALREVTAPATLPQLAADIRELAKNLLNQGVGAEHLTQIISTLNDRLSQRVIESELLAAGIASADLCWIALGSEGRHEQTLASDQDNGIIFRDPKDGGGEALRSRLLPIAQRINEALASAGFPLCRGNIMAGNPRWCLSGTEWRENFNRWISQRDPEAILNATIFFDFRPLFGDTRLATDLRAWLDKAVRDSSLFLRLMADNALTNRPPLGLVRDFSVSDDKQHPHTIDLKVNGATLFIDAARVFALATGVTATNTAQRLRQASAVRGFGANETDAWATAFHFLQQVRLRHQQQQITHGDAPDNYVDPDRLNDLDRRILKEALRTARSLQNRLALDYQLWAG